MKKQEGLKMSAFSEEDNKLEIASDFKETEASVNLDTDNTDTPDLSEYRPRSSGVGLHINTPTWSMIIGIIAIVGIIGVCAFAFFFDPV